MHPTLIRHRRTRSALIRLHPLIVNDRDKPAFSTAIVDCLGLHQEVCPAPPPVEALPGLVLSNLNVNFFDLETLQTLQIEQSTKMCRTSCVKEARDKPGLHVFGKRDGEAEPAAEPVQARLQIRHMALMVWYIKVQLFDPRQGPPGTWRRWYGTSRYNCLIRGGPPGTWLMVRYIKVRLFDPRGGPPGSAWRILKWTQQATASAANNPLSNGYLHAIRDDVSSEKNLMGSPDNEKQKVEGGLTLGPKP